MLFSANANRPGILRLRCKENMNFKNVQYYSGLFFAGLMILLTSNSRAADPAKLTEPESISTLYEEQSSQTPTIFGGVGRKFPTWPHPVYQQKQLWRLNPNEQLLLRKIDVRLT